MALYLGSTGKRKVYFNGIKYKVNRPVTTASNSVRLLSSDGMILKDKNGVFITAKDGEILE